MSNACAVGEVHPDQAEFPFDDPRLDEFGGDVGGLQLVREWRALIKEHGHLVTRAFAAEVLGCTTAQIASWVSRGRLTDCRIGPVVMVPIREVLALWHERAKEGIPVGGRGKKAPSMYDAVRASVKIFGD